MALKAFLEQSDTNTAANIEGRRHPRRALKLETSGLLQGGSCANVTIHNLSAAGLLIETDLELVPGEKLEIALPDAGSVRAEIVWVSERLYGCAFEQALSEAALAASQLQSDPAPQEPAPQEPAPQEPARAFVKAPVAAHLGALLNRLRRERSMTLEQVAKALGVSKPTVWAWEKGKARPLPERLEAIAQVLGVPLEKLSDIGPQGKSGKLVEDCRLRIASEYGTSPESVRIMIEV